MHVMPPATTEFKTSTLHPVGANKSFVCSFNFTGILLLASKYISKSASCFLGSTSHIAGNLLKSERSTSLTGSKNSILVKLSRIKSAFIMSPTPRGLPITLVLSAGFLSSSII